jgi:hypothetical protein
VSYNIGNFLEKIIKNIWLKKTLSTSKKLWNPFWIIINDTILKFHNTDKREIIKDILLK